MICRAHGCTQEAIPSSGLCGFHEEEAESGPIHYKRKRQNRSREAMDRENKRRRERDAEIRRERQQAKDYTREIIKEMVAAKRGEPIICQQQK